MMSSLHCPSQTNNDCDTDYDAPNDDYDDDDDGCYFPDSGHWYGDLSLGHHPHCGSTHYSSSNCAAAAYLHGPSAAVV